MLANILVRINVSKNLTCKYSQSMLAARQKLLDDAKKFPIDSPKTKIPFYIYIYIYIYI